MKVPFTDGVLPPAVFTRCIRDVSAKMPGPCVRFGSDASSSHGMESRSTMTDCGGKAPTTWLPLLLVHVGPPEWLETMLPSSSNRVALGTAGPQSAPFHV